MSNLVMPGASAATPSCTVVICTRDRAEQLDQCLESVMHLEYPRFEVLVVDSAPRNGLTREVALRRGVRYIVESLPGVSRARNRGALSCDTEIVAFLDDDAVCEPTWLSALAAEFKDPSVMVVTGRILPLRVETEAEKIFLRAGGFDPGEQRRELSRGTPSWFEMANFGGIGNEAGMAFRREAFDVWPGFDKRLGPGAALSSGAEGQYAFFSLIESGYRVVYTPRAVVYHPYPRTLEELRRRHLQSLATSGAYLILLFVERSHYRRTLIRYAAGWLRGTPRTWRGQAVAPRPRIVPRWRELLAYMKGLLLYARSLYQN